MTRLGVSAAAVLTVLGCSSSPGTLPDGGSLPDSGPNVLPDGGSLPDAGNPPDSGFWPNCEDGGAPNSCNTTPYSGSWVAQTQVAQSAPAATGGTSVDGTYFLTSSTVYTGTGGATGPDGQLLQKSLVFSGNTVQQVNVSNNGSGNCEERSTLSVTFTSPNVTASQTCPAGGGGGGSAQYIATATTFTLYSQNGLSDGGSVIAVEVYTKQ